MKNIYKVSLFLLIIMISSCDLLNKPEPKESINVESLDSYAEYQAFLGGTYNGLQNYAPQLIYLNDSMTGFVDWLLSFTNYRQIGYQEITVNNTVVENIWNQLYSSINAANIIIANVNSVEGTTQSQKDNILGQAYFLRAIMYYYLVEYWAKPWGFTPDNSHLGVPLKLEPVLDTDDFKNIGRATVKEVYDQIIKDLRNAAGLTITNTSPSKATNGAVTALRARIALIQERWEDAADFAGQILASGNYSLSNTVTDYFRNEFGPESIFEIANTSTDNPGGGNYTISVVYNINTRPGVELGDVYKSVLKEIITDKQEAALNTNNQIAIDSRVTELLATNTEPPLSIDDYTHSAKYEDNTNLADNIPVIRLSEMILTRAEALAYLINNSNYPNAKKEAVDLLNKIRTRAIKVENTNGGSGNESLIMFTTADFQTKDELIEAIFRERSVELSFEGHRRTDLQRREMDVRGIAWDADELTFPIPQSQMDVNDNIKQNPGYGE